MGSISKTFKRRGKKKMKMHLLCVPVMILLIFNGGEVECRSLKALVKQVLGKVNTVLTHTEVLLSQLRPITIQIDNTIGNFTVEILDITFTDQISCPTISVNQKLAAGNCLNPIPRNDCLVSSISAKNSVAGDPCTIFQSQSGTSENEFLIIGSGTTGCIVKQLSNG